MQCQRGASDCVSEPDEISLLQAQKSVTLGIHRPAAALPLVPSASGESLVETRVSNAFPATEVVPNLLPGLMPQLPPPPVFGRQLAPHALAEPQRYARRAFWPVVRSRPLPGTAPYYAMPGRVMEPGLAQQTVVSPPYGIPSGMPVPIVTPPLPPPILEPPLTMPNAAVGPGILPGVAPVLAPGLPVEAVLAPRVSSIPGAVISPAVEAGVAHAPQAGTPCDSQRKVSPPPMVVNASVADDKDDSSEKKHETKAAEMAASEMSAAASARAAAEAAAQVAAAKSQKEAIEKSKKNTVKPDGGEIQQAERDAVKDLNPIGLP